MNPRIVKIAKIVINSITAGIVRPGAAGLTPTVSIARMVSRVALRMDSVGKFVELKTCQRTSHLMGTIVNKCYDLNTI